MTHEPQRVPLAVKIAIVVIAVIVLLPLAVVAAAFVVCKMAGII